jgi:hypothetical protein
MFCWKCGAEIKEGTQYCSSCGNRITSEEDIKQEALPQSETDPFTKVQADQTGDTPGDSAKKSSRKGIIIILIIVGIVGAFLLADSIYTSVINRKYEETIAMVQNGYLGEYTDITIGNMLNRNADGWTWDGGKTDDDKMIVEASRGEGDSKTIWQFTVLDDHIFKIYAIQDASYSPAKATDVLAYLNLFYYSAYLSNTIYAGDGNAAIASILDELDMINASWVLYGASADYTGDRSAIGQEHGETPIAMSAKDLLVYYGYVAEPNDTSTDYSRYEGEWGSVASTDDSYIQVSLSFTDKHNPVEYNIYYWNGWNPVSLAGSGYIEENILYFEGQDDGGNMVEGSMVFNGDEGWIESNIVAESSPRLQLAFGKTYMVNLSSGNVIDP